MSGRSGRSTGGGECAIAAFPILVGGIVVGDGMDRLSPRDLRLDGIEEANELLVAMTLHVAADYGSVEDIEGGEQCRRAVALVVVGHRSGASRLHGQARLATVERLDLALLVDREDDSLGGWIDVEADDVAQLGDEPRVGGQLELLDAVRLKAVFAPDTVDGTGADIDGLRHHGRSPLGRLAGGSVWLSATTRSATLAPRAGMRDGRVLSRSKPS